MCVVKYKYGSINYHDKLKIKIHLLCERNEKCC